MTMMPYTDYDGDDDDCQERKVYVRKTEQYADQANTEPLWHTVVEAESDSRYFRVFCHPVDAQRVVRGGAEPYCLPD